MSKPLSQEDRAELTRRYVEEDDESMIQGFPFTAGDAETSLYAYPMGVPDYSHGRGGRQLSHPDGAVWLPELIDDDERCLTAQEAGGMAVALLMAAKHVEEGPDNEGGSRLGKLALAVLFELDLAKLEEDWRSCIDDPDCGFEGTFSDWLKDVAMGIINDCIRGAGDAQVYASASIIKDPKDTGIT